MELKKDCAGRVRLVTETKEQMGSVKTFKVQEALGKH